MNKLKEIKNIQNKQQKETEHLNKILDLLETFLEDRWIKWRDSDLLELIEMANEDKFILDYLKKLRKQD